MLENRKSNPLVSVAVSTTAMQPSRRRRRFRSIRQVAAPLICPGRTPIGGGILFSCAIPGCFDRQIYVTRSFYSLSVTSPRSNLRRAPRKDPIGYNGTSEIYPQNCPFPFDDHHQILIHPFLDRPHSPPQTASKSNQPFRHSSLLRTDRQMVQANVLYHEHSAHYADRQQRANNNYVPISEWLRRHSENRKVFHNLRRPICSCVATGV